MTSRGPTLWLVIKGIILPSYVGDSYKNQYVRNSYFVGGSCGLSAFLPIGSPWD